MVSLPSPTLPTQQAFSPVPVNFDQQADGDSSQSHSRTRRERAYPPSRILIHAINFAPELIGCGKYTTELAEFLSGRGHEVEVVTAPPHYPGWHVRQPYRAFAYQREVLGAINITRCPMLMKKNGGGLWRLLAPLTFALSAAPAVLWRILRARPDVVLCVEPTLFSSPVAVFGAKLIGARVVLHVQDLEIDAAFDVGHLRGARIRQFANLLERRLLQSFDQIVTISAKMRHKLIGKGLDASKVDILHNWIDLDRIRPQPRTEANVYRRELGIDESTFAVLYTGHVGAKQALHVLIDAARRLVEERAIVFVIAGDGPAKTSLLARAGDLPNIRFLPLQPADRLNDLLNMADLHALPQDKGAADLVFPSKLAGMLASGRPVAVTADVGTELAEMLAGVASVTPAGDAEALASAISDAKGREFSFEVKKGLELAATMSSTQVLALFEATLLAGKMHERREFGASVDAAPEAAST